MATVGINKDDPSILLAHLGDEQKKFPAVHARLEFRNEGDQFTPVLTLLPIIDENGNEEEQRYFSEKLKALIVDYIKPVLRLQWSPADEHLCVLIVKDGKKMVVPLKKPEDGPSEAKIIQP